MVPSYSSAKSVFAGLTLMRLEKKYPGIFNRKIADYVPDCAANGNWGDVTFANALDMATGNYALAGYMSDEDATHTNNLFLPVPAPTTAARRRRARSGSITPRTPTCSARR